MSEPSGLPSALGIEAVEWLPEPGDGFSVRVRGRWLRRRPTWTGQPLLVIETGAGRHRFPAMPEPPSLTGTAPGTWQMTFSVPGAIGSAEDARAWLQLGSVALPLPIPVRAAPSRRAADPETLGERRIRGAELAAESAMRKLAQATADADRMRARIAELEVQLAGLRERLAEHDRAARGAEQEAFAERAVREELEERLAAAERAAQQRDQDERGPRIAELERELRSARRALDEAEHVARAAQAAQRRSERAVEQAAAVPPHRDLSGEFALAAVRLDHHPGERRSVRPSELDAVRLRQERRMVEARAREASEATALREELAGLRSSLERERERRSLAEQRVLRAYDAIQEVREELERMRAGSAPTSSPTEPGPAGAAAPARTEPVRAEAVEAERLTAALTRLRETRIPVGETDEPPRSGWLERPLRSLARRDREGAAGLLAVLLPAPAAEAHAAAALLAGGRLRRVSARLRGQGELIELTDQMLRAPLRFERLRLEPHAALTLAAALVEPAWSAGERFAIAHESGPCLHVRGGARPLVTEQPLGEPSITISCAARMLPAVLAGARPAGTAVAGERRPLELLEQWLKRAQSG